MLMMVFASNIASGSGVYDVIWLGAVMAGIGWGMVETVVNPLIATLYPDSKTGEAERAACVVAGRTGHRRAAGRGFVEPRRGMADEAGAGRDSGARGGGAIGRREVSADGTHGGGNFDGADVSRIAESDVRRFCSLRCS